MNDDVWHAASSSLCSLLQSFIPLSYFNFLTLVDSCLNCVQNKILFPFSGWQLYLRFEIIGLSSQLSAHTSGNGKVLFYLCKCKTKQGQLSMVPLYADHYVLPIHEITIQHDGARPPLLCCVTRLGSFFRNGAKKSARASGFHLIRIMSQSSQLSVDNWQGTGLSHANLAAISRKLKILAFCWYRIKANDVCITGKKWHDRRQKSRDK